MLSSRPPLRLCFLIIEVTNAIQLKCEDLLMHSTCYIWDILGDQSAIIVATVAQVVLSNHQQQKQPFLNYQPAPGTYSHLEVKISQLPPSLCTSFYH